MDTLLTVSSPASKLQVLRSLGNDLVVFDSDK